jgi:hypothetical protein
MAIKNTKNQDYIIDHVGAENLEMVVEMFDGKNTRKILCELDEMFPADDNAKLAKMIYNELN